MTEGFIPPVDGTQITDFRDHYQQRAEDDLLRLQAFLAASPEDKPLLLNPDEYIPGVVSIAGSLYPESAAINELLYTHLRSEGYMIDDLTTEEARNRFDFSRSPEPELMRAQGWSTGFAKLSEEAMQRVGVCGSCKEYISTAGIHADGHACEKCGEVTFEEFPKGSQVSLSVFRAPENPIGLRKNDNGELTTVPIDPEALRSWGSFVVESNDRESGLISLYGDLTQVDAEGIGYGTAVQDGYRDLSNHGHYDRVIVNRDDVSRAIGHRYNARIVKLFGGKEYGEWDRLPAAETFNLYEPWHWVPKTSSPELHNEILHAAGQVSDKGYYYQDGRPAFSAIQLENMRRFVDHFTALNLAEWDEFTKRAPRSGPGFIDALAYFCSEDPDIIDKPNIGNFLVGLADSMSGKRKGAGQIRAEMNYLRSEGFEGSVDDLISMLQSLSVIPTESQIEKARQQRAWIQDIWQSLDKGEQN